MLVDMISSTDDWMSLSVMRLMCPFLTSRSQIWSGLLPIEYRMDRNPDWNVFLNIALPSALPSRAWSAAVLSETANKPERLAP